MITITVHKDGGPTSYRFNQELIVIGDGLPGAVDICFPAEGLHQNHVRIQLKHDTYQIINQSNDPFVTLNGQPFGKKPLKQGDQLQIRNHLLMIDEISFNSTEVKQAEVAQDPYLNALYDEEDPEIWMPSDLPDPLAAKEEPLQQKKGVPPHPVDPHVEEAYQLNLELPIKKKEKAAAPLPTKKRWKMHLLKCTAIAVLIAVTAASLMVAELYLRASNLSESEEMAAAESLADYAMALTYAKIYHMSSQKQNIVDPQFIRNNLIDLLSSTSIPCGDIDPKDTFCNSPYFLRYYTNRDASRFVLIAQPSPNLSQWLFPKKAIIVDSSQMKLRFAEDLRQLNRLLSSNNALDGEEGDELSKTIQQMPILKLSELAIATEKKEFDPPAALKFLNPGAEEYIYNAPRYHHLSGTFLKKAQAIIAQPYGPQVASLLQGDLDTLAKLPHLIFYVDTSMAEAAKTRHVLRKLSLSTPFLTAYILHDRNQSITNSRLVFDSAEETIHQDLELAEQPFFKPKSLRKIAIEEDPNTLAIREAAESAYKTIVPTLQSLHTILSDAAERDSLYLTPLFYSLLEQYEEQKKKTIESLEGKVTDHPQVERLLRETGLWDLYQEHQKKAAQKQQAISTKEKWKALQEVRNISLKKNNPPK